MHHFIPQLTLIATLMLSNVQAQGVSLSVGFPEQNRFGKPFNVEFSNPNPANTNWIGIYKHDINPTESSSSLWSTMCGNQNSLSSEAPCPPQGSGVVTFKVQDPDLDYVESSPLNPGRYKACMLDGESAPYTVIECTSFRIRNIPNRAVNESTISPTKSTFSVGEDISVEFFSKVKVPNSWIGLYNAEDVSNTLSQLPSTDLTWLYSGCNNQEGDQDPSSEDCSNLVKRGSVTFNAQADDDLTWPLPVGNYRVCLSFFVNSPYSKFVCSDSFLVESPTVDLGIASTIAFGSDITVSFANSHPSVTNWIGLYDVGTTDFVNDDLHWASMCGDQDSWDDGCAAQSSGAITFSGADPDQESNEQWPISPGDRLVCLMDDETPTPLACEAFTISDVPASDIDGSSLTTTSSTFSVGESISAAFSVPTAYQNTWVGIYRAADISNGMTALPGEPLLWVYSGCNNQQGDQSETNNCQATRTSGTIDINETSQDRSVESWPLGAGEYYMCMSFYNNDPYEKFVCTDETFDILV